MWRFRGCIAALPRRDCGRVTTSTVLANARRHASHNRSQSKQRKTPRTRSKSARTNQRSTIATPGASPHSALLRETLGYDLEKVNDMFNRVSGRPGDPDQCEPSSSSSVKPTTAAKIETSDAVPSSSSAAAARQTDDASVPLPSSSEDRELLSLTSRVFDAIVLRESGQPVTPQTMEPLLSLLASTAKMSTATTVCTAWVSRLRSLESSNPAWGDLTTGTLRLLTTTANVVADALATVTPSEPHDPNAESGIHVLVRHLKDAAETVDMLWTSVGVPANNVDAHAAQEDEQHFSHRTTFSSLNFLLRFEWHHVAGVTGSSAEAVRTVGRAGQHWMTDPQDACSLLEALERATLAAARASRAFDAMQPLSGTAAVSHSQFRREIVIPLLALLARTLLDVETHVCVVRASARKETWCFPARLDRPLSTPPSTAATKMEVEGIATERTRDVQEHADMTIIWRDTQSACLSARVHVAQTLHNAVLDIVTRLTQLSTTNNKNSKNSNDATDASLVKMELHNLRVLVGMVKRALYALLRRHYLETAANPTLRERDTCTRQHGQDVAVYTYALHTFLLLQDAAEATEGIGRKTANVKGARTCGTTLSQAMDVIFFLHLHVANRWSSEHDNVSVDSQDEASRIASLITPARVEAYIKEALCDLQHNTAKQLWHLRQRDDVFYFSGLRRDGTFTHNTTIRARQAQSVLGVVHAHAMHPSLLWMPLWQLQELVTILGERPHLLDTVETPDTDATTTAMTSKTDRAATPSSVRQYPTLQVGSRSVTLTRLHCYVVLRLFVVSNVLRACRSRLLEQPEGASSTAKALSYSATKRLRVSAKHEPSKEPQRRQHRDWSSQTVDTLLSQYPTLAAEIEGLADSGDGHARALARLESTVRYTLDHHLFVKAADLLQAHGAHARRDAAATRGTSSATTAAAVLDDVVDATLVHELSAVALEPDDETHSSDKSTHESAERRELVNPERGSTSQLDAVNPHDDLHHPLALPPTIVLRWSRASVSTPLGFSVDKRGCILRVTRGDAFHQAAEAALSTSALPQDALVGWRVETVNGQPVAHGRALVSLLKDELQFVIRLSRPSSSSSPAGSSATKITAL